MTGGDRSAVRAAIEAHLRFEPRKESKSRIKRLRDTAQPQYRLRVGEFRVFYDVTEGEVQVLAALPKSEAIFGWTRKGRRHETVPVTEIEKNVSKYLLEAAQHDVVITRMANHWEFYPASPTKTPGLIIV